MKEYKIITTTARNLGEAEDTRTDNNEILIVKTPSAYCLDIEADGVRIVPILRKMEAALTAAGWAGESGPFAGWFGEWANSLTDPIERKYFIWNYSGDQDRRNGCWSYSWGIEQHDGSWYVFLNLARDEDDRDPEPDPEPEPEQTETAEAAGDLRDVCSCIKRKLSRAGHTSQHVHETVYSAGLYYDGEQHGEAIPCLLVEADRTEASAEGVTSCIRSALRTAAEEYTLSPVYHPSYIMLRVIRTADKARGDALQKVADAFLSGFWGEIHRNPAARDNNGAAAVEAGRQAIAAIV